MRNAVQCKLCGVTIESRHRHDFQTCDCGNISIDGGEDYWKRAYREPGQWIELGDEPGDEEP